MEDLVATNFSANQDVTRTLVSLGNPRWGNAAHTIFMCDVVFEELASMGMQPFDCTATDTNLWSVAIWNDAVNGVYDPITEYEPPVVLPHNVLLTADQFYTLLDETLGVFTEFDTAINTVTPASKKVLCRNQFNNSQIFTWDMVLMTVVAPKVWGATWQADIGSDWIAASGL